jgi:glutamate---cysteine ligase / carboxylate-amine ligase
MNARADSPEEQSYGEAPPYTLGVEEELFLVDPIAGEQINASGAVLERVGELDGTVERELYASQVELITSVCERAGEAAGALAAMRRAVTATGAGLLGAGTHPSAEEGEAEITDGMSALLRRLTALSDGGDWGRRRAARRLH